MESTINKVDNKLTIKLDLNTKHLDNRQLMTLNNFVKNDIMAAVIYMDTFKGKRTRVRVNRFYTKDNNWNVDVLKEKKPGKYLAMFNRLFDCYASTPKPNSFDKHYFGVEIECLIPRVTDGCGDPDCEDNDCGDRTEDLIAQAIREKKLKNVRIKGDGSLTSNNEYKGLEFVCLTSLEDMNELEKLCEILKKFGAKVDSTCGLHVHLDARDGSGNKKANRLVKALPMLNKMVPQSRLNNSFCRQDRSRRGNRYAKINTQSLRKYQTVEVRMHSGTIKFDKISNWIKILNTIATSTNRIDFNMLHSNLISIDEIGTKLSLDATLVSYIKSRTLRFSNDQQQESEAA